MADEVGIEPTDLPVWARGRLSEVPPHDPGLTFGRSLAASAFNRSDPSLASPSPPNTWRDFVAKSILT